MKFLQRLWLLPENKETKKPVWITPQPMFPHDHKIDLGKPSIDKSTLERIEKRFKIWKGNILDMINGYDRLKWKQLLKNKREVPYNDPKDHYRWNIDRVLKMSQEEINLERGNRYRKNMDDVFTHIKKEKHETVS